MPGKRVIEFTLNGRGARVEAEGRRTLLEVLREDLLLTGCKEGCAIGECGACTVLLDGLPVLACLTLIGEAEGKSIRTVEGLRKGETLHPIQKAFMEEGAIQCGYCTPGMLLSAKALLDQNGSPTRPEIQAGLGGNICRCTGYQKIFTAVENAARIKAGGEWD